MIALLLGAGFVYAFAFDGFNVETATGGEVEEWLAAAGGGGSGDDDDFDCKCLTDGDGNKVSCGACEVGNKCSGSKTPSSCIGSCAGGFCSENESGYCGGVNAIHDEYCPKDPDAIEYYCEKDNNGCSEENN